DPVTGPGRGFNTIMLTLGGAWYFDPAKSWWIAGLTRTEFNSRNDDTGITVGDSFTLEWGLAHRLKNGLKLGLVGYDVWQFENNSNLDYKQEQHALGAEVGYAWRNAGLQLNAAVYSEYESKGVPEGNLLRVTLTKAF